MQCKLGLHITDDWRYSLPVFDSIDFELYEISNILVKKKCVIVQHKKTDPHSTKHSISL